MARHPTPSQLPEVQELLAHPMLRYAQGDFSKLRPEHKALLQGRGPSFEEFNRLMEAREGSTSPTVAGRVKATAEKVPLGGLLLESALPTAGAIAGSVGGTLLGPLLGPAGVVGGEMVGGGVGEWLNQQLGITEPSLTRIGISAAGGPIGRTAAGVTRIGSRFVRGAFRGFPEHVTALGRELATEAIPLGTPSSVLYRLVDEFSPKIRAEKLAAAARTLEQQLTQASPGLRPGDVLGVIKGIQQKIAAAPGGELAFQDLRVELRRLGERIGTLERQGGEGLGAYKFLRKAIHEDFEAAAQRGSAARPAVRMLRDANRAASREFAQEDLGDILNKATTYKAGKAYLNPDQVLTVLERGTERKVDKIVKSLDPGELDAIKRTLGDLARLYRARPAEGLAALPRRGLSAGLLGAGFTMSGPVAGLGAAALPLVLAPGRVVAFALMTPTGRELLKRVVGPRGVLDSRAAGLLGAYAASFGAAVGERVGVLEGLP